MSRSRWNQSPTRNRIHWTRRASHHGAMQTPWPCVESESGKESGIERPSSKRPCECCWLARLQLQRVRVCLLEAMQLDSAGRLLLQQVPSARVCCYCCSWRCERRAAMESERARNRNRGKKKKKQTTAAPAHSPFSPATPRPQQHPQQPSTPAATTTAAMSEAAAPPAIFTQTRRYVIAGSTGRATVAENRRRHSAAARRKEGERIRASPAFARPDPHPLISSPVCLPFLHSPSFRLREAVDLINALTVKRLPLILNRIITHLKDKVRRSGEGRKKKQEEGTQEEEVQCTPLIPPALFLLRFPSFSASFFFLLLF